MTTAVIEITAYELEDKGFDKIWDDIRIQYPEIDYDLERMTNSHDGKIILITLRANKYYNLLDN